MNADTRFTPMVFSLSAAVLTLTVVVLFW